MDKVWVPLYLHLGSRQKCLKQGQYEMTVPMKIEFVLTIDCLLTGDEGMLLYPKMMNVRLTIF